MPSIENTINKIISFEDLAAGWNFGEGMPLQEDMSQRAEGYLYLAEAAGVTNSDAFLGDDGELQILFFNELLTVAFSLETDGSVLITKDKNGVILSQNEVVNDEIAHDILWQTVQNMQNSLESSISIDGLKLVTGFQAPHLSRLLANEIPKRVYPSLRSVVQYKIVAQSASTSRDTTTEWQEFPQSFGIFLRDICPASATSSRR